MIDYFLQHLWLLWLIMSFLCLIIELSSGDFYFVCFSFGALLSIISAALGHPFWLQVLVWAAASVLCILLVRPPIVRKLHAGATERKSNADALIGKQGTVIEAIQADGSGYVKIDGDEWRSVSAQKTDIPVGTTVKVLSRDSIILTVIPVNQTI